MRKCERQVPSTFQEAETLLNGKQAKNLGGNTVVQRFSDDVVELRLHGHCVARFYRSGQLQLSSAGWRTNTTKSRLQAVLRGRGMSVYQKNFDWFVVLADRLTTVEFEDNMLLN